MIHICRSIGRTGMKWISCGHLLPSFLCISTGAGPSNTVAVTDRPNHQASGEHAQRNLSAMTTLSTLLLRLASHAYITLGHAVRNLLGFMHAVYP